MRIRHMLLLLVIVLISAIVLVTGCTISPGDSQPSYSTATIGASNSPNGLRSNPYRVCFTAEQEKQLILFSATTEFTGTECSDDVIAFMDNSSGCVRVSPLSIAEQYQQNQQNQQVLAYIELTSDEDDVAKAQQGFIPATLYIVFVDRNELKKPVLLQTSEYYNLFNEQRNSCQFIQFME